jgi:hypothetical protein
MTSKIIDLPSRNTDKNCPVTTFKWNAALKIQNSSSHHLECQKIGITSNVIDYIS